MDTAKELIANAGEGDLQKAVKDYYLEVNSYYNLVTTFPQGYSKLTYSQALADCKADCQSAYSEVEFYL